MGQISGDHRSGRRRRDFSKVKGRKEEGLAGETAMHADAALGLFNLNENPGFLYQQAWAMTRT